MINLRPALTICCAMALLLTACAVAGPRTNDWVAALPERQEVGELFLGSLPEEVTCQWDVLFASGQSTPLDGEIRVLLTANPERWGLSDCDALLRVCASGILLRDHGLAHWGDRWQRFCEHGARCRSRRDEMAALANEATLWEPPTILAPRSGWSEAVRRYALHLAQHDPELAKALLRQRLLTREEAADRCQVAVEYARMVAATMLDLMAGDQRALRFVAGELARPDVVPETFRQRLVPHTAAYENLTGAYNRYRQIVAGGGFKELPGGYLQLRRSSRKDSRHRVLANRLVAEGLFAPPPAGAGPLAFGTALEGAVKRFQRMHHLTTTGAVGPATLAALNVSAEAKAEALQRALAAYRQAVPPWESTFIYVQMPAAYLEYYVGGVRRRHQRVVLGRPEEDTEGTRTMATPVLNSAITAVIFNPEWHVPSAIAHNELQPLLENDPGYLTRNHFRREVSGKDQVRYVQSSGDHNALGRVKFHFANSYDVYLHDTPRQRSFRLPRRLLSHGCVRVEKAVKLAAIMLNLDQGFNWAKLREVLKSVETTEFQLRTPIPVHLVYSSAAVDADGNLHFMPDLYGRESIP